MSPKCPQCLCCVLGLKVSCVALENIRTKWTNTVVLASLLVSNGYGLVRDSLKGHKDSEHVGHFWY